MNGTRTPSGEAPAATGCGDSCAAGSDAPIARSALGPSARAFQVSVVDCAEGVRIPERAVDPVVGGEARLALDVLNGRMSGRAGSWS